LRRPGTADEFLNMLQGIYRMDRGDRIYVKRHFKRWFKIAEMAESILDQKGGALLDVGCGSGFFLMLTRRGVGLDYGENVDICVKRGLKALRANLEEDPFPFADSSFALVTCLEVIEHLKNPENMLKEIRRVLRGDGTLLLSTPNSMNPLWTIRDALVASPFLSRLYAGRAFPSDLKRYSLDETRRLLARTGFDIESVVYLRIILPADDVLVVAKKKL